MIKILHNLPSALHKTFTQSDIDYESDRQAHHHMQLIEGEIVSCHTLYSRSYSYKGLVMAKKHALYYSIFTTRLSIYRYNNLVCVLTS